MITTSRDDLAATVRSLRDHGASLSDHQRHTQAAGYLLADYDLLGYNFRMTDMQGAIGSVQMDRAEWILAERHRCAETYDRLLGDVDWLSLPVTPPGSVHGYQSYVCLFRPEEPKPRIRGATPRAAQPPHGRARSGGHRHSSGHPRGVHAGLLRRPSTRSPHPTSRAPSSPTGSACHCRCMPA